jgi:hypothetical protein
MNGEGGDRFQIQAGGEESLSSKSAGSMAKKAGMLR